MATQSQLVTNPITGYAETTGNYVTPFDSPRKDAFLSVYRSNGLRIRRACNELGLSVDTINRHLHSDPLFKQRFDAVEADYLEELESVSRTNALNPKSVIERIFQLKCSLPDKYGQENKPQATNISINIDGELIKKIGQREQVVDAEIVRETDVQALTNP